MTDFGPPVQLPVSTFTRSPPAIQKIKRGGQNGTGNSSTPGRRFHAFVKGLRDPKKPGKHGGGTLLPRPKPSPVVWDPSIYAAMPKPEPRVRVFTPHVVTAPRPDPIYQRRRELRATGMSRRRVREAMAHERS